MRFAVLFLCFGISATYAETPEEVFTKRIVPIFQSPKPSSCVQCHLAGIDLKNYILPSHRDTFISLRDQGLVDLDQPERSKILTLIQMGEGTKAPANLIHEKTRQAELAAFTAWLKSAVTDNDLRNAPKLAPEKLAGATQPLAVVRHARKDRLLESFENTIWAMRFRCMSCHRDGTPDNKKHVEKWGEQVAWFKPTAEASLDYLLKSNLINPKDPEKSLLLQKPLNLVKHEGGKKFELGDLGYKAYRTFIEDYIKTLDGKYKTAASLPKPSNVVSFGTDRWIKFANTPEAWADKVLQVHIFAYDHKSNQWEETPIASTDRRVWGKGKLWQHNLTLHATANSERAKAFKANALLPQGTYLIKVYVDHEGRLEKDWNTRLGEAEYVGQCEIQSNWREGYGAMTTVDAAKVKK